MFGDYLDKIYPKDKNFQGGKFGSGLYGMEHGAWGMGHGAWRKVTNALYPRRAAIAPLHPTQGERVSHRLVINSPIKINDLNHIYVVHT